MQAIWGFVWGIYISGSAVIKCHGVSVTQGGELNDLFFESDLYLCTFFMSLGTELMKFGFYSRLSGSDEDLLCNVRSQECEEVHGYFDSTVDRWLS